MFLGYADNGNYACNQPRIAPDMRPPNRAKAENLVFRQDALKAISKVQWICMSTGNGKHKPEKRRQNKRNPELPENKQAPLAGRNAPEDELADCTGDNSGRETGLSAEDDGLVFECSNASKTFADYEVRRREPRCHRIVGGPVECAQKAYEKEKTVFPISLALALTKQAVMQNHDKGKND